ncbi:DUF2062 domain-containing protein [Sphingobium sp. MK2]|uniref:DUF2062 domain-containing protein n=1 Tax=Sphingobium sp. MK2 TaxID=3116540 RepID=UPI0032E35C83
MRKWFIERAPDRDVLLKSRWLAPVASRLAPATIWQFNRRSIARGLALGLFVGFILPIGQIILAVLFAASIRANILIASAATLITNPLTFPPIYYAAYRTGTFLLDLVGGARAAQTIAAAQPTGIWTSLSATSLSTFVGLLVFATLSSLLAFAAVHLAWRVSLIWRWRRRGGTDRAVTRPTIHQEPPSV